MASGAPMLMSNVANAVFLTSNEWGVSRRFAKKTRSTLQKYKRLLFGTTTTTNKASHRRRNECCERLIYEVDLSYVMDVAVQ
jgi:hypothetical protein